MAVEESQNELSLAWVLKLHPVRQVELAAAKKKLVLVQKMGKIQMDIHLVVQTVYSVLVVERVRFDRCRGQCARSAIAPILPSSTPSKIFTAHTIGEFIVAIRKSKVDRHSSNSKLLSLNNNSFHTVLNSSQKIDRFNQLIGKTHPHTIQGTPPKYVYNCRTRYDKKK